MPQRYDGKCRKIIRICDFSQGLEPVRILLTPSDSRTRMYGKGRHEPGWRMESGRVRHAKPFAKILTVSSRREHEQSIIIFVHFPMKTFRKIYKEKMKMVKRVVSIEAGVWWTKVALADYRKKNPPVHKAFAFRTPEHAVEDGYIRDKEAFASALKTELSRHDIHEKEVVFTLSSSKVVTREVMIPFVKDNKIMGIIEAQIRDYFPMDVSNYTISYSKMDVEEEDGKKMLKLLLVAIPDNLLNNYVTFAELAGLKVETFDYIGNGTVQLLCDSFLENAVVVQLEEQATVISILENKKLVFQRVTPYDIQPSDGSGDGKPGGDEAPAGSGRRGI